MIRNNKVYHNTCKGILIEGYDPQEQLIIRNKIAALTTPWYRRWFFKWWRGIL